MFAILWRSSLALPTAEGDRSPRADGETAKREKLGLPGNKSRILLGKYLRLEISLILSVVSLFVNHVPAALLVNFI